MPGQVYPNPKGNKGGQEAYLLLQEREEERSYLYQSSESTGPETEIPTSIYRITQKSEMTSTKNTEFSLAVEIP